REFQLEVAGLAGAQLAILGMAPDARIRVTTDDLRELRVFVTLPRAELARLTQSVTPFALMVRDVEAGRGTCAPPGSRRLQPSQGEPHEPRELGCAAPAQGQRTRCLGGISDLLRGHLRRQRGSHLCGPIDAYRARGQRALSQGSRLQRAHLGRRAPGPARL